MTLRAPLHKGQVRKYSTISPYKIENNDNIKPFGTMDIETINLNDKQVPIAITYCYNDVFDTVEKPNCEMFLINKNLIPKTVNTSDDIENAVIDLFKRFFENISKLNPHTIFVHNLGSFDGYFILKYLSYIYEPNKVNSIIDDSKKFIQISFNITTNNDK